MRYWKETLFFVIVFFISYCIRVKAEDSPNPGLEHFTAHAGASFAINTIAYGACTRGLSMPKPTALIVSAATTLIVGIAYKAAIENAKSFGTATLENGVGVIGSDLAITLFKF